MKYKNIIIGFITAIVIAALYIFIIPIIHENNCKSRVYADMKENEDIIKKSIVGIMPETVSKGLKSHGGFGSGVIFEKAGSTYYAVTAKHVINDNASSYKLFTITGKFSNGYMVPSNIVKEVIANWKSSI